jgi:hypothetical protein
MKRTYGIATILLLLLCAGRGYLANGDFTYFFVAGSDFVDGSQTPGPVFVQQGQGYDGQFFYRYALDPLDFSKTKFGVTTDLVPYRIQRIGYPVLAWLLSGGGNAAMVPVALLLVNLLAFFGILYFAGRFASHFGCDPMAGTLPLLLCGLYMSVARELSEVTELFFFMGALYGLIRNKYLQFVLFATCCVLTRETSLVALIPALVASAADKAKTGNFRFADGLLLIPLAVVIAWKYYISMHTDPGTVVSGTGNFGIPFAGMMTGFKGNLHVNSAKNVMQLFFWLAYFLWQVWLIILVVRTICRAETTPERKTRWILQSVYLTWAVFAIFLSAAIYIDDWSFVRVFSLWSMTGFLVMMVYRQFPPWSFMAVSWALVILTVVRLIIRP